jgi:outer membrane protein OmpA-like peptidoglycan-associated protein
MKNLLFAALLFSASAFGQKRVDTLYYANEKVIVETDSTTLSAPKERFLFNSFWDNWFVAAGAGGNLFFGNENGLKPWHNRLTGTYEISAGKWVHPIFGIRAKVGGGPGKAFTNGTFPFIGVSLIKEGPDANGIYTERWHQLYGEIDLMLDLNNTIGGYKKDRLYSAIFYIGAGAAKVLNQPKNDGDRSAMGVLGLINRFRIARRFDLYLEFKDAFVDHTFERLDTDKTYESFMALTGGIIYHFGDPGFKRASEKKTAITRTYTHIPIPAKEQPRGKDTVVKEETVREVLVERKLVLTHPMAIFFELNQSTITDRAKVNLAFVADIIKSSGGAKFVLVGSADSRTASPSYNQALSRRRSDAVRDYLVRVLLVDPGQLITDPIGGIDRYSPPRVNRTVIIRQEQP